MKKVVGVGVVALAAAVVGVALDAQQQPADGANAVIPWAYTLNAPPPSGGGAAPDPTEVLRVPGSSVTFMRSQLRDLFNPPDWHPDNHPAMPPVVANGRAPDVRACGFCHLPNGQGRPLGDFYAPDSQTAPETQPTARIEERLEDVERQLLDKDGRR